MYNEHDSLSTWRKITLDGLTCRQNQSFDLYYLDGECKYYIFIDYHRINGNVLHVTILYENLKKNQNPFVCAGKYLQLMSEPCDPAMAAAVAGCVISSHWLTALRLDLRRRIRRKAFRNERLKK